MANIARVQDIHYQDATLRHQYVEYCKAGNYTSAGNLLLGNPQLDTKALMANLFNAIADELTTLQGYYTDNVTTPMENLLMAFNLLVANFKDLQDWEAATTYERYMFVHYQGDVYMYINETAGVAHLPTDTTYWALIGLRGEQGAGDTGLNLRYNWSSDLVYNPLDVVYYNNVLWVAKLTSTGQTPQVGSQYWLSMIENTPAKIYSSVEEPTDKFIGQIWIKMKE